MESVFCGDDGYVLAGKVPGLRGVYPTIRFRYRPCLPEETYSFLRKEKPTGAAMLAATTEVLKRHLVEWNVVDAAGQPVPITEGVLRKVYHPVLESLLNHVFAYAAADADADEKN